MPNYQTKKKERRSNHNALVHRYYKISKFYPFLKDTAIKAGIVIVVFVGIFIALDYFFFDFDALLNVLVATYKPPIVFGVFLISETILGLVPPEIFIAWSSKSSMPWLYLFMLATMSYLGGVLAYYFGNRLFLIPSVKNHIENKIAHHIVKLKKWGGLFVFIGAMLPIPHSVVSLACGLIKYNFKHYLLWALFRYLRFALYGAVIFQVF
jgi:membrane protein YqaA with SNARE-associated domain